MTALEPRAYGPVLGPLLAGDRRRPLGAGLGDPRAEDRLHGVTIEAAFAHATLVDIEMADCCLAGLWLLHDFLHESHAISQRIETASGSFWHAIMHRREGDFGNAKYWFRHVGYHDVFDPLGERAEELIGRHHLQDASEGVAALTNDGDWRFSPTAFVDLVESVERGPSAADNRTRDLCLDLQQAEWELLFDHCYRAAVGK